VTVFPHHVDMVGSMLRPAELVEARAAHDAGRIDLAALRSVEDQAITALVRREEAVGLPAVTDGEFRRTYWHLDFLTGLGGIEAQERPRPKDFDGGFKPPIPAVVGKVHHTEPIFADAFGFLADAVTTSLAKVTVPGPGMAHFLGGPSAIDAGTYPDHDAFWDDLAAAYRAEVAMLYSRGCRYLQFDDISFAYLCDSDVRAQMRERGEDPDELVIRYRDALNAVTADRPSDLLVTTHMCRGNFRSKWVASGGYEPVAEAVFGGLDVDAFFLEFDSERAGGFEPLRHLAPGRTAVLGLVTSKTPELERPDDLRRRLDDASKYVPLERLAISPQCGFSSTHHGNDLTEDDQWRKLELLVELADDVWQ